MNIMTGLILKDLYNLKRYLKQIGLIFVIFGFLALQSKDPTLFIGMVTMIFSMLVITSMSYDDFAKWDKYALTMPILRKDIVLSKYILFIILMIVGTVASGILSLAMNIYLHLNKAMEVVVTCGVMMLVIIFLFSILMPLLLKYGVEKSRILIFVIVGAPAFFGAVILRLMKYLNIPQPDEALLEKLFSVLPYASIVLALLALILSYNISVRIYEKKEF
jgi:ABC-type transport system involved in multi-copper enzyme maturation permease subunit